MPSTTERNSHSGQRPAPVHSWDLSTWPADIWPNDTKRAKWVLRSFRYELIAAGALARGGKGLIVLGRGYSRWLERRAAYVREYTSNNPMIRAPGEGGAAG